MQPLHRRLDVVVAQHDGDVHARAALRHHRERQALERAQEAGGQAGVVAQPLADRAYDRHAVLAAHVGEAGQLRDDRVERAAVVDGDGDAHLRGRDHVDRRAEALEDLEHAAQEAVGHQHPRGGDVDAGDAPLARDRRGPVAVARGSRA